MTILATADLKALSYPSSSCLFDRVERINIRARNSDGGPHGCHLVFSDFREIFAQTSALSFLFWERKRVRHFFGLQQMLASPFLLQKGELPSTYLTRTSQQCVACKSSGSVMDKHTRQPFRALPEVSTDLKRRGVELVSF